MNRRKCFTCDLSAWPPGNVRSVHTLHHGGNGSERKYCIYTIVAEVVNDFLLVCSVAKCVNYSRSPGSQTGIGTVHYRYLTCFASRNNKKKTNLALSLTFPKAT